MNLSISGHHVSVSPSLKSYVTGKLDRLRRHFDQVIDIKVLLSVDKLDQKAEMNLHVRGRDIHAEATNENLYTAIDKLVDKLDRQLLKHKTKRVRHGRESLKYQVLED